MAANESAFFLYLPFHLVHAPNQVPARYAALYPHVADNRTRTLLGMVSALDEAVGMVVDGLKRHGVYNSTGE